MDLIKAIEHLSHLRTHETDDLLKYAKVHALLDVFKEENTTDDGVTANEYDGQKIDKVELGFQVLCGLSSELPLEQARTSLIADLQALQKIVGTSGKSLLVTA